MYLSCVLFKKSQSGAEHKLVGYLTKFLYSVKCLNHNLALLVDV